MNKKKIIRRIAKWKIYFDRARLYISYVQFLLLAYIAIKQRNNSPLRTWVFDNWYISFPLIFIVFFSVCMVLGFIESLFKIREYEQENYAKTNPFFEDMMKKLDRIERHNTLRTKGKTTVT